MNKINMYKSAANKVIDKAKEMKSDAEDYAEKKKKRAKSTIHDIHETVYKKSKELAEKIKPKKKR